MLKNKKLAGNFFALFTLYIANYVLPFLTIPYLSRLLTVEHYGLILYSYSFTLYFGIICEYGFNFTAVRDLVLIQKDQEKINELVSAVTLIKFFLFLLCLVSIILVVTLVPKFSQYWYIYLISSFGLLNNILFPTWFFRGIEQMWNITFIGALMKVISVILILMLVHHDSQFYYVPLISSIAGITSGIVAQVILYRKYLIRYKLPRFEAIIRQMREGWYIFISTIATSLYGTANAFLLGLLSSPISVAFYVAAEKLVTACLDCIGIVSQVVFPDLVQRIHENMSEAIHVLQRNLYFFIVMGMTAALVLYFGSPLFIKIMFGSKYINSIYVLQIMSVLPLASGLSNVLGQQTMIAIGMNKQYTMTLVFAGLLNVLLIYLLVPKYSYIGSAYAVTITELAIPLIMAFILFHKGIYVWSGKLK